MVRRMTATHPASGSLLVTGRWVVRDARRGPAGLLHHGGVLVNDGRVRAVDDARILHAGFPQAAVIEQPDGLVMPGLINAHHHGRGVGPLTEGGQDGPLELWMFQPAFWAPLPSSNSRLYTLARQLRSGVTSSLEAHMERGPLGAYRAAVDDALAAYRQAGMRVALTLGLQDKNRLVYDDSGAFLAGLPPLLRHFVEQTLLDRPDLSADDYFALWDELTGGVDSPRIRLFVGSTAPQWLSDDGLRRCASAAERRDVGLHLHLNETHYERAYGPRSYGEPVVEHLDRLGVLSPRFSAAHAVWLDDQDMAQLAAHGASVVHNPSSNLRLHSGIAPVRALLAHGVNVALGMDSNAFADDDDMLAEMRLAYQLHRGQGIGSRGLSAYDVLAMATTGGAQALVLEDVGTLEVGMRADVVVVAMERVLGPAPGPTVDPVDLLVARGKAEDVRAVLVEGEVLVHGGALTRLDLATIRQQVAEEAAESRRKFPYGELAGPQAQLHQLLRSFYERWDGSADATPATGAEESPVVASP